MFNREMIEIIFRLVNFGIAIFLISYVFKRFVLPSVKRGITDYIDYFKNLRFNGQDLEKKSKKLDIEIENQEKLSQELLNKINIWQKSVELENKNWLDNQQKINERIEQKFLVQQELITLQSIQNKILPDVISNAESKLKNEFEVSQNLFKYHQSIIELMKSSKI